MKHRLNILIREMEKPLKAIFGSRIDREAM
jgi:hypothetical protein